MENQIYRITRRRTAKGVELTLVDHPKVRARADSDAEAEEALLDAICAKFGDGEPVLDYFDEPAERNLAAEWWCFRCNESATAVNLPDLYADGVCDRCGVGLGARLPGVARRIEGKLSSDAASTWSGPIKTRLVSPRMIRALVKLGLSEADFAPVLDAKGKSWGEILPRRGGPGWVPVKARVGVKIGAQKCRKCGFSSFGFVHVKEKDIRLFIAATESPATGNVHVFGAAEPDLAFSAEGRKALRGQKELRGFVWGRVGLVASADIEPKLKFEPFPKP